MWISRHHSQAVQLLALSLCAYTSTLSPFVIASAAPTAPSGLPRSRPESDLANDPHLRKQFREEQVGGPLKEYLAGLTDLTEVTLTVPSPIAESGFTALKVDTEVSRVLKGIARIYHRSWTVDPGSESGYTLLESDADRKRRLETHAAISRKAASKTRQRWDEVRRLAFKSDRELKLLAGKGDALAQCLLHPRGRPMAQLVYGLPPTLLQEMWNMGSVEILLSQLPGNLQQLAAATRSGGTFQLTNASTGLPVELEPLPPDSLRLEVGGTVDRPTVFATVTHGYHGLRANLLYAEGWSRQPPAERRADLTPRKTDFPPGHPLLQKVTLRESASRAGLERGERPRKAAPLAQFLKELAEQGVPPLLASCDYWRKDEQWLAAQWWLAADIVDQPLYRALDLLCADFEYEWVYREGILLLWPKRWYAAEQN